MNKYVSGTICLSSCIDNTINYTNLCLTKTVLRLRNAKFILAELTDSLKYIFCVIKSSVEDQNTLKP